MRMAKIYKILILIIILTFSNSCMNFKYAKEKRLNPSCPTSISGKLVYNIPKVHIEEDILFLKGRKEKNILFGKITGKTDKGFLFDPSATYRSDRPEKEFEFDEIECLMDTTRECVFGEVPEKYKKKLESFDPEKFGWNVKLFVKPFDDPDSKQIIITMKSGEEFAYCLPAGKYFIEKVKFDRKAKYFSDVCDYVPRITLDVREGVDNYIGHLVLDDDDRFDSNTYHFHCKILSRPDDYSGYKLFGLFYAVYRDTRSPFHTITIDDSLDIDDSRTKSILQLR